MREAIMYHYGYVDSVAWSPDGRRLAVDGDWGLYVYEYNGHDLDYLHYTVYRDIKSSHQIAWSPDGKLLAAWIENQVVLYNPVTKTHEVLYTQLGSGLASLAWSPDGKYIASGGRQSIVVYDVSTRTKKVSYDKPVVTFSVAWSPDSKFIATDAYSDGEEFGFIMLHDIANDEQRPLSARHTATITSVAWSPDGRWLVSCSRNELYLSNPFGSSQVIPNTGNSGFEHLSWSPDSRRFVAGRGMVWGLEPAICVYNLSDQKELKHTPSLGGGVECIDWSRIGNVIAVGTGRGLFLLHL